MPEIKQRIGEMTGDQFLLVLKSILDPKLEDLQKQVSNQAIVIGDLNAKVILLEARLAAVEAK